MLSLTPKLCFLMLFPKGCTENFVTVPLFVYMVIYIACNTHTHLCVGVFNQTHGSQVLLAH
jgi:hypothetical protein